MNERVELSAELSHEVDFLVEQYRGQEFIRWDTLLIAQKITNFVTQVVELLNKRFRAEVQTLSIDHGVGFDELTIQIVDDAVGSFYDKYLAPLDIPYVPSLIEGWIDPSLKSLLQKLARGIYNEISRYFNQDVRSFGSDPLPLKGIIT